MVNRFWQATGFCPPFAFLPDGSGIVIGSSKRRICQTCKFLPKNTLFRSPAMVLFDPKTTPPPPPKTQPVSNAGSVPFAKPPKPTPPNLQCPRRLQLGLSSPPEIL